MEIKKLLENCVVIQSPFTKTGVVYISNNIIILEHVKSTNNIWMDEHVASKIVNKDKAEKDVVDFFLNKNVRNPNVYMSGLNFNFINKILSENFFNGIDKIVKEYLVD